MCLAPYLSYPIASSLLPPLSLFGSRAGGAAMFYDLAPEPMGLQKWDAAPHLPQFCLGLCTDPEFPQ